MKNIFLILIMFTLSLTGVMAQDSEQLKPILPKGEMVVLSIVSSTATISAKNSGRAFIIDAPKDLVEGSEYFFILEVSRDSEGKNSRTATVRFYHITAAQAEKNIREGIAKSRELNE